MLTLRTTDWEPPRARTERFLDGTLRVVSRSGLHPTEAALIQVLPGFRQSPASLLIAGNRTGVLSMTAAHLHPRGRVVTHVFDRHHAVAVERNLAANGSVGEVACAPFVPAGSYDAALLQISKEGMSGELVLDLLEDVHSRLADGAVCCIACDGNAATLCRQMKRVFGNATVQASARGVALIRSRRTAPQARRRKFEAFFEASIPGGAVFRLMSLPGVFSHRRPDAGGLALAETAARFVRPGDRVLDIGCGSGLVGIALALSVPDAHVTFLDSHARAAYCAEYNARACGLRDYRVELSDTGTAAEAFTLAAANPPYFSDYRIASLFIRNAAQALSPGGRLFLVAKSAGRLVETMRPLFDPIETWQRRGYEVIGGTRIRGGVHA